MKRYAMQLTVHAVLAFSQVAFADYSMSSCASRNVRYGHDSTSGNIGICCYSGGSWVFVDTEPANGHSIVGSSSADTITFTVSTTCSYGGGTRTIGGINTAWSGAFNVGGAGGGDTIYCGRGYGDHHFNCYGEAGADELHGNNGFAGLNGGSGGDDIYGGPSYELITCGSGGDYVEAGDGDDVIDCGDDVDEVWAEGGHDWVDAGDGSDYVYCGTGDDYCSGGDNSGWETDRVWGSAGNDVLDAGNGVQGDNDRLYGGNGNDYLIGNDQAYCYGEGHPSGDGDYCSGSSLDCYIRSGCETSSTSTFCTWFETNNDWYDPC
jgi:Ca2+-binding RTX toxin-like protein